ncbi:MAG: hypothetical protein AAGA65_06020 [Actinomycetota bacterium]
MIEADAHRFPEPSGPPPLPDGREVLPDGGDVLPDGPGAPPNGTDVLPNGVEPSAEPARPASGVGLPPRPEMRSRWRVRTPLWRRVTALFTLSFMSVVAGLLLAATLGIIALLVLFVLERAIAT